MPRAAGLPHLNSGDSELDLVLTEPRHNALTARPTPPSTTHHDSKMRASRRARYLLPPGLPDHWTRPGRSQHSGRSQPDLAAAAEGGYRALPALRPRRSPPNAQCRVPASYFQYGARRATPATTRASTTRCQSGKPGVGSGYGFRLATSIAGRCGSPPGQDWPGRASLSSGRPVRACSSGRSGCRKPIIWSTHVGSPRRGSHC